MISDSKGYKEAFVWVWLPQATAPVVTGRLTPDGKRLRFNYGKGYLGNPRAIPLYAPELPLQAGVLPMPPNADMPGCIRDAAPDAWGRRVILNRKLGLRGAAADSAQLDELTYLLESGSDRIGALDFQASATEYVPRSSPMATLEELLESAARVEQGIPLSPELGQALQHGSSIGGARPKALLEDGRRKLVAKFSASTDWYNVVKSEFIAMRLAQLAGLQVAQVELASALGKDVLLIERFDRIHTQDGWQRKIMVSALTLFGLDEMLARYASYEDLAELVRHRFTDPTSTLRELFARLVFNILVGNTDDHARNHAAFWDGEMLTLTPAYDICPQGRTGNEATQAMLIAGNNRMSRIAGCIDAAHHFLLERQQAIAVVEQQLHSIGNHWLAVCDEAELSAVDRQLLWGRQFLNPFAFEHLDRDAAGIAVLAADIRQV